MLIAASATPPASAHPEPRDASRKAASHTAEDSFGQPGKARDVTRTITITLRDAMRFEPATLQFSRGQTVRFHVINPGKLPHEFVLGTRTEIAEHAKEMQQMPNMAHTDPNAVRVAPGQSADLVWRFSVEGQFLYACLLPGHWEAGMQGTVTVVPAAKKS
jgi:uncharacterized cupredoxin-like copper-binding protein